MLDDFVSRVIAEVLGSDQKDAPCGKLEREVLNRPNYQREKAKNRLKAAYSPAQPERSRPLAPENLSHEDNLSALRKLVLKAGSVISPVNTPPEPYKTALPDSSPFIKVISGVNTRTLMLTGLSGRETEAVGIVCDDRARVSCLMAADIVLTSYPGLEDRLKWNEEMYPGFQLIVGGRMDEVTEAMNLFSKTLKAQPIIVRTPSIFLQRKLRIDRRLPLAALDCINFCDAFEKIDFYYRTNAETTLEFIPGRNYLLGQGEEDELIKAFTGFIDSWAGKE